jgi:hypothetical protein
MAAPNHILFAVCICPEKPKYIGWDGHDPGQISMPGKIGGAPLPNRLANESSPYLLQHANNPVDWFPWGDEAFTKAKAEDKPVFLSIGYSTCHWCHIVK